MDNRRRTLGALVIAVGAALGIAVVGPASAASAVPTGPDPMNGVLTVQLAPIGPHTGSLAGFVIEAYTFADDYTATTDASGSVTFRNIATVTGNYSVLTDSVPQVGAATFAPAAANDTVATTSTPHTVTLPLVVGATVTGLLVGPDGAPLVGADVDISGPVEAPEPAVTTDATGRYTFHGVETGVVDLSTRAAGQPPEAFTPYPTWEANAVAQTATSPARTETVATKMVHTAYDLDVGLYTTGDRPAVSGAIVRARNVATGATYDERTDYTVHASHEVVFIIPSGTYTIELITRPDATQPVQTWWYPGPSGYILSQDASTAGRYVVRNLGPGQPGTYAVASIDV